MESDEEDFVFYGTPIEREEEIASRRKKSIADASGHLRALPPWKQEVTDEEGRRRFHGAFTGGFSAGYYNTVGSKEGWAPQAFTSSRKNRAEVKQQSILNFLDDDERAELEGKSFRTSSQFDTFGFTAAELARKQVEKEQQERPSAIPGPVPDELVIPVTESIGIKLLLKMGWRRGRSIKDSHSDMLYESRREARKALLAFSSDDAKPQLTDSERTENHSEGSFDQPINDDFQSSRSTPVFVLNPKQDLHGLGYDPFRHAPEFRERKRSRMADNREPGYKKALPTKDSLFGFKSGKVAPGFGIGALEEYDVEDEDVYTTAYDFEDTYVEEVEEPTGSFKDKTLRLLGKEQGVLPGFLVTSKSDYQLERFDPPSVPKDFVPHHKFSGPLETDIQLADTPPPEVSPPGDNNMKLLIDGVATLVARCGKLFEDLSREKNRNNPLFSFLNGGNGCDYYARKLWEGRQKHKTQSNLAVDGKLSPMVQKMTAESRGKLLGEKPLERSSKEPSSSIASENAVHIQNNLSDTFTKSASYSELHETTKPFKDDPAKQERFEKFLKEKYQGGLRSTSSGGASNMSEAARARERLDFEAAAEALEKAKHCKENSQSVEQFMGLSPGAMQFTSGGVEQQKAALADNFAPQKMYPKREEFPWRPSPILCKRFDLTDPFMGKPPPAPRIRSKLDSLMFLPDSVKPSKLEESIPVNKGQPDAQESVADKETEVEVENVERPVDLYKAIFSDDSDDEAETIDLKKVEDPEKKIEVAQTALNHLIAGDFLESLGKELGLEVPPEVVPNTTTKLKASAPKESVNVTAGNTNNLSVDNKSSSTQNTVSGTPVDRPVPQQRGIAQGIESLKRPFDGAATGKAEIDLSGNIGRDKIRDSSSSSEDERSRKCSRRHRHRSSDSYSDSSSSSSDYRDRYHSKSKDRKKRSSHKRRGSSSRRKHHKHKHRDSASRYDSEKEKRKRRDR